jgi:hypothetical protein
MFNPPSCTVDSRSEVIDFLLEYPAIGLDSAYLHKWLGEPMHRRYQKNGNTIFVFTVVASADNGSCGYNDLFCVEFSNAGKLIRTYLKFITDSEDAKLTLFWHSGNVPPISKEGDVLSNYLNIF